MDTKWIIALAAALAAAPLALGHFPPTPDTNCNPAQVEHDFVAAGSVTATTGMTGEVGGGVTLVIDGSLLPCAVVPFCPPGSEIARLDPDGENPSPQVDPNGEDVIVWCDDLPPEVQNAPFPVGDGEYEFGLGGAFLPDSHHDPLANGYTVTAALTDGGFIFGNDTDGDGSVEEGSGDCFESHAAAGTYATACAAGADGGWWFFTKCNVTAASDWTFTTNGPLLRLGLADDDADDIPNSLEDDDSDGLPNGLDDSNTADDFVNANWNPTVTPGSVPPDASASCLALGHVGSA